MLLKLKRKISILIALVMTVMLFSPGLSNKAFAEDSSTVTLQILGTSDLHGRFVPWDYATDTENTAGSLAQIAAIVKQMKQANPNTIIVDNGDTIQDNSSQIFLNDEIHPMILAMNEIGYDTYTLGNHEFNYGVPALEKVISKFKGKVLGGNVYKIDGSRLAAPYTIVEKGGVKVGIIGITNPNITKWDKANLEGYTVTSPIEETKKAIEELKGKVDVIVATIHVGPTPEYGNDDGADLIAQTCPELAAIVAGHAHLLVAEKRVNGVAITEPNRYADNVSKIEIKLTKNAQGKYDVADRTADIKVSLIPVKGVAVDKELSAKLQSYDDKAKADARTVIGYMQGSDLVQADEVKGIPACQVQDNAMIDLINEVQMYYTNADVAAAAAFKANANIKQGPITKAGVSQIYMYDNTLYKLQLTGKQLKMFMEWSASYYNTYKTGDLTVSFNPNIRGYNYDMFSGVKYEVDISKEPGSRIVNLRRLNGTVVEDNDVLILAVNNYRANSQLLAPGVIYKADDMPKLLEKDVRGEIGGVRELIREYIQKVKGGSVYPNIDNNWRIEGTTYDLNKRATAIRLINEDKLAIPASADERTPNVRSITWEDVLKAPDRSMDILSFNDFHGSMKTDGKNIGAAKLAGEIKKAKEANPDTIVVSGGDIYQGSAMSNLTYGKPVTEFLKEIGLVASAVGNHEFDWGIDKIPAWESDGSCFDFLASNIYDKNTGFPVPWAKPYKIVIVGGIKIGFIGLTTPETAYKTKPDIVNNLEFKDPALSVNYWAKYLKTYNKADYVVALTHFGASVDSTTKEIKGEAAELAKNVKNVDAIIAAHTHESVKGYVNNIPIVQAYYNGRSLAKLAIGFNIEGKYVGIKPSVDELYNRKDLVEDSNVKAIYENWDRALGPVLNEVLGATDKELSHDKNAGVSLLGEWSCDVMKKVAGTQIAITNGGGLRTSIPKGEITMGKLYEVMPFDNTLVKMELMGSDIKKNIEVGIANTKIGWVQLSGIKVYYDSEAAEGSRITSMYLLDGTKIEMDKYYTVVTNDFMATGGDGYSFSGAKNMIDTAMPIRDALVNEIKEVKNLSIEYQDYLIAGPDPSAVSVYSLPWAA